MYGDVEKLAILILVPFLQAFTSDKIIPVIVNVLELNFKKNKNHTFCVIRSI